jgi:hypothetical protein
MRIPSLVRYSSRRTSDKCAAILAVVVALIVVPSGLGHSVFTITGFGAMVSDWNRTHKMDTRGNLPKGCCYVPIASHSGLVYASRYFGVEVLEGRVLSYQEWLGDGTSVGRARLAALRELPPDARVQSFTVHNDTCAIMIAASRTLGTTLRHGAAGATVIVEFKSGTDEMSYNPASVNDLRFNSGYVAGPAAQSC